MNSTDNYTFSLTKRSDVEDFERNDKNICRVRYQSPSGEMVSDPQCLVEITLTRDAMIGLGTELIRAAKSMEGYPFWKWHPADRQTAIKVLGTYLHPSSCRLSLGAVDFEKLRTLLERAPT